MSKRFNKLVSFSVFLLLLCFTGNVSLANNSAMETTKSTKDISANQKLIALSFDDGPSETTMLVLDKLQKYDAVASFFLIGLNITDSTKSIVQRELSMGCEVNSHSWSHSYMSNMSSTEIINEMQMTSDTIYKMVGLRPKFFRPPYAALSNTMYEAIDLPFIGGIPCWDWDPSVSAETRAKIILENAKDGDIVGMHDFTGNTQTVEALDTMLKGLIDRGFKFVTISQLFEQNHVDPNVKYKIWSNVND